MIFKNLIIFIVKIVAGYYFLAIYLFLTYWSFLYITGDRYDGYGGTPYSIRARIIEKSQTSVRLEILNHSILIDSAVLMKYDPIEKVKNVSPDSVKLFKIFHEDQVVLVSANIHNGEVGIGKRAGRILDVLSVENNKIDLFGADIHKLFAFIVFTPYLVGIYFLFKKELTLLLNLLKAKSVQRITKGNVKSKGPKKSDN